MADKKRKKLIKKIRKFFKKNNLELSIIYIPYNADSDKNHNLSVGFYEKDEYLFEKEVEDDSFVLTHKDVKEDD